VTPGEEHGVGDGVSAVKAGHVFDHQIAIYDTRREVLDTGKKGWLAIWNARRAAEGKPALDLADKHADHVWRFEMRLRLRQLRNRWEIRGWDALQARAGDAIAEFAEKMRYSMPSHDRNRSLWPLHPAWGMVQAQAAQFFKGRRDYADPVKAKEANRATHIEMLDAQWLGLMVSRAAAGGVGAQDAKGVFKRHAGVLARLSREHSVGIEDRMAGAAGRITTLPDGMIDPTGGEFRMARPDRSCQAARQRRPPVWSRNDGNRGGGRYAARRRNLSRQPGCDVRRGVVPMRPGGKRGSEGPDRQSLVGKDEGRGD
jgi:hypothetical protein